MSQFFFNQRASLVNDVIAIDFITIVPVTEPIRRTGMDFHVSYP